MWRSYWLSQFIPLYFPDRLKQFCVHNLSLISASSNHTISIVPVFFFALILFTVLNSCNHSSSALCLPNRSLVAIYRLIRFRPRWYCFGRLIRPSYERQIDVQLNLRSISLLCDAQINVCISTIQYLLILTPMLRYSVTPLNNLDLMLSIRIPRELSKHFVWSICSKNHKKLCDIHSSIKDTPSTMIGDVTLSHKKSRQLIFCRNVERKRLWDSCTVCTLRRVSSNRIQIYTFNLNDRLLIKPWIKHWNTTTQI